MTSRRAMVVVVAVWTLAACDEDPLTSTPPEAPPPTHHVQAFVQVSDQQAQAGQEVRVFVRLQLSTETSAKLGSYMARLAFDPTALVYQHEVKIDDGMRVTNPNGAAQGELRFAGASATGFDSLLLYEAVFEVKKTDYLDGLRLEVEELSTARSLTRLDSNVDLPSQVFLRRQSH